MNLQLFPRIILLVASLLPTTTSAFSISFSSAAECNAGLGRITNSGPMPAANCSQEQFIPGGPGQSVTITADASARSNWGQQRIGVHAEALVSMSRPAGLFHASATTMIHLTDEFNIEALNTGGLSVDSGTLTATMLVVGSLQSLAVATPTAVTGARLDFDLRVGDSAPIVDTLLLTPSSFASFAIPVVINASWVSGQPILVDMTAVATAVAEATGENGVQSIAQFGNSLEWGGIQQVLDEQGMPVASFTALSPDGVNWASPAVVPLPAAAWLFGSALGWLVWMRRKAT